MINTTVNAMREIYIIEGLERDLHYVFWVENFH